MSDVPPALGTVDRLLMDLAEDGDSSFSQPIRESDLNLAIFHALREIQEHDNNQVGEMNQPDEENENPDESENEVLESPQQEENEEESRRGLLKGLFGRIRQAFSSVTNCRPKPRIIRTACAPISSLPSGSQHTSEPTSQPAFEGTMHIENPVMKNKERPGFLGKIAGILSGVVHKLHEITHLRCRKETEIRAGFNRAVAEKMPQVTRFLKRMDVLGPIRLFSPLPTGFYDTCYHNNGAIVYVGVDKRFVVCHKATEVQDPENSENAENAENAENGENAEGDADRSLDRQVIKRRELHVGHVNTIFGVFIGVLTHVHNPYKLLGLALRGLINATIC